MDWISDPNAWTALAALTALEIVLGIDNIIFISILAGRLPAAEQPRARFLGLAIAMVSRILLLFSITWVMQLTAPCSRSSSRRSPDVTGFSSSADSFC